MYYNHKEDATVTERPSKMWKARFLQRIWSRLAFVQLHPAVLHLHAPVRNIEVLLPMFLLPHFVWMIQEKQTFGAFRTFYIITIPKLWLSSQYWAVLLRAEWHLEWFLLNEYTIKSFCTKHATTISCWLVFLLSFMLILDHHLEHQDVVPCFLILHQITQLKKSFICYTEPALSTIKADFSDELKNLIK